MIKISCSQLEQIRNAPALHGQQLAIPTKSTPRRSGMFAAWKETVQQMHLQGLSLSEALKLLNQRFFRFQVNKRNKRIQTKLTHSLITYREAYDKKKFEFVDSKHTIKWEIINNVSLSGYTPWVVHNKEGYHAYMVSENPFDWQHELRFPLFQEYLATNCIDCDVADLYVGIYCLSTNSFEFKIFSKKELKLIVTETGRLCQIVLDEYNKWKK